MLLFYHRKPDPQFFLYACKVIGVEPNEAIFLDDIGMNLRAAKKLGMTTIRKSFFFWQKKKEEKKKKGKNNCTNENLLITFSI